MPTASHGEEALEHVKGGAVRSALHELLDGVGPQPVELVLHGTEACMEPVGLGCGTGRGFLNSSRRGSFL